MLANEIQKETKCYKACWLLQKKTDESNLITGYWGKKLYDPQERWGILDKNTKSMLNNYKKLSK